MVSSEEMRRRLDAKRKGVKIPEAHEMGKPGQETVKCPECQTENPTTAKFCVGCGAPMAKEEPKVSPTPETVTEQAEDYKICPSCNQKNKPNAKFCIICGHKFEDSTDSEETTVPEVMDEEEDSFPAAKEILEPTTEEQSTQLETDEPLKSVSDKPLEEKTIEPPAKETETPVIPEIKVPEHLKPEEVQEKPVDVEPETHETKLNESAEEDVDPVEKIKKAKDLLDIGAITQEEFDKIKNKYLEQI